MTKRQAIESPARPWEETDREAVVKMLRQYLRESRSDFPAEAAEAFFDHGVRAAVTGDPVFLVEVGGVPVAFTLWFRIAGGKVLSASGTYVEKKYRRSQLALRLRQAAIERARALGCERISGSAKDAGGLASAKAAGFRVSGYLLELAL